MIEILAYILSVVVTTTVVVFIVHVLNRYERKSREKYKISCEYMRFRYSYSKIEECTEELNKLGTDGWEIAVCAGEDSFAAYLILKRETLHTS